VTERFAERMADRHVRDDTRVLAGLAAIYCAGHHADRNRTALASGASALGVYGHRIPRLCPECAVHVRYAEQRRAYCPKDPKPFCAHCDTRCYEAGEAGWQRQMMRYAGPRSVLRGYAVPALKHALEARRFRRATAALHESDNAAS